MNTPANTNTVPFTPKERGYTGFAAYQSLLHMGKNPVDYFNVSRERFGETWFGKVGPYRGFFSGDQTVCAEMLTAPPADVVKSPLYRVLAEAIGDSLLSIEGERWKRLRKKSQPAFTSSAAIAISDGIHSEVVNWKSGLHGELANSSDGVINIQSAYGEMALRVVVKSLFGVRSNRMVEAKAVSPVTGSLVRLTEALAESTQYGNEFVGSRFRRPVKIPITKTSKSLGLHRRFHQSLDLIRGEITDIIGEFIDTDDAVGLLSNLASPEKGGAILGDELRDLVSTMFFAGQETTANSLSWATVELIRNPGLQEGLRKEALSVSDTVNEQGSMSVLSSSPLLVAFLLETLRLYPSVMVMGRSPVNDVVVTTTKGDSFQLLKGDVCLLSPYLLHTNKDYWDRPMEFDPSRWPAENIANPMAAVINHPHFMPFGRGGHTCIGYRMAIVEMALALHEVLKSFKIEGPDQSSPSTVTAAPAPALTMKPIGGVSCRLIPVDPVSSQSNTALAVAS